MNILDKLAANARKRVAEDKQKISADKMQAQAEAMSTDNAFAFEKNLKAAGLSVVAEVKKASPSKGLISPDFPYLSQAKAYEAGGVAAISCLTEPTYFLGKDAYLKEITETVAIPVLRKDFTVDAYQIYQAKTLGASAVLLICAILDDAKLKAYLKIADSLGLSALVETHDENEINRALDIGARVIGVNNRDLKTFHVDFDNAIRLREKIPKDVIYVSESGVKTADDARQIASIGADAVLVGETLMRSDNPEQAVRDLRAAGEMHDEN